MCSMNGRIRVEDEIQRSIVRGVIRRRKSFRRFPKGPGMKKRGQDNCIYNYNLNSSQ